jgi:ribokinase
MTRAELKSDVVVVGSLNLDYIAGVARLPTPGETVSADSLILRFGGKGANQAIAAARQGARVAMIGCVGADSQGAAYLKRLQAERVNTAGIFSTPHALCGAALIAVDRAAENMIVVAPGANVELKSSHVRTQRKLVGNARVVLVQFEIPMSCIIETVKRANLSNVPVVLNPSPFRQGFPWGKGRIDTLIVNAGEAATLFKHSITRITTQLRSWRRALAAKAIVHLVITRGAEPTLCITARDFLEVPGLRVTPVDTVGAGDAFAGAFVAHRAKGADLCNAIRYANVAGALATLKPGAQESIPTLVATERALRKLGWPIAHGRGEGAEK